MKGFAKRHKDEGRAEDTKTKREGRGKHSGLLQS